MSTDPRPAPSDTARAASDDHEIADRVSVVLVPSPGRLAPLEYRLPAGAGTVGRGSRVLVPLGARRAMGVVVEVGGSPQTAAALRDVIAILDPKPVLDASLLQLIAWMADYYLAALGEVFATALPGALRVETERIAMWRGADAALAPRPASPARSRKASAAPPS